MLTEQENDGLIIYLARHPDAGAIISETGGVRKLRWASGGKGKAGGARIIYYYYSDDMPLILLFAFLKGEQENLSNEGKKEMRRLTKELKREFRKG